jgi:zinc transport system substrate-binding protein
LHALETKDPANINIYKQNSDDYCKKLTDLDSTYKTALALYKGKEIVYGGHYAFGYLAHRYGLKFLAAQGFSPDAEPTARDLSMLVEQIRKDNIKYVFFEELTSPKIAETVADETRTKLLLLNAAHNVTKDQFVKGTSFLDIMKSNLDNLKIGLGCP